MIHTDSSSGDVLTNFVGLFLRFGVFGMIALTGAITTARAIRRKLLAAEKNVADAAANDPFWNEETMLARAREVIITFFNAWTAEDVPGLEAILSENMRKATALELAELELEKRKSLFTNFTVSTMKLIEAYDDSDNTKDSFSVLATTAGSRVLTDETGGALIANHDPNTDIWKFVRVGDTWMLDSIAAGDEAAQILFSGVGSSIFTAPLFAKTGALAVGLELKNNYGFFEDSAFGKMMVPMHGAIFNDIIAQGSGTGVYDHILTKQYRIGLFESKIIQAFVLSVLEQQGKTTVEVPKYYVAVVTLPKSYGDILIRHKTFLSSAPRALVKRDTESEDFNKMFSVYSTDQESMETFELLSPTFMEKLLAANLPVTIEAVGNTLYVAFEDLSLVTAEPLLRLLSGAYEEIKN